MPPVRRTEADSYAALSPRGLLRRALGSASIYTVGLVGVRGAEFLLLPLYWALLSPQEYGIFAIATVVIEFLKAVFGFGLPEAISRFYYDWPRDERRYRLGSIWSWAWLGSIVLAAVFLLVGDRTFGVLIEQASFSPYIELAIVVALTSSMSQVPLMTLRIIEKPRLYVIGTAATTLLSTGLAIFMIAALDRGVAGLLEAQAIAYGVMAVAYAVLMLRWARPNLKIDLVGGVLAFSLPLIPSKLLEATATIVDRFLLEKHISLEALGIYHAARQVGRGVEILGYGLLTAWIPFEIRVLAERAEDGRAIVARVATHFLLVILLSAVALALLAPGVVELLGITEYLPVAPLVPIAVLPAVILSLAHILIQGYIIARKTQYAWLRSGARLATVIVAMLILLPPFGIYGAFFAMAIAAFVNGVVGLALSQRFLPIPFDWNRLALMAGGAIGVVGIGMVTDSSSPVVDLGVALILVLGYVLVFGLGILRGSGLERGISTPPSDTS